MSLLIQLIYTPWICFLGRFTVNKVGQLLSELTVNISLLFQLPPLVFSVRIFLHQRFEMNNPTRLKLEETALNSVIEAAKQKPEVNASDGGIS
ncbi:unnamed protein product [Camellia sinensis]